MVGGVLRGTSPVIQSFGKLVSPENVSVRYEKISPRPFHPKLYKIFVMSQVRHWVGNLDSLRPLECYMCGPGLRHL